MVCDVALLWVYHSCHLYLILNEQLPSQPSKLCSRPWGLRCDMAFIEPMHRNKPNITYLLPTLGVSLYATLWMGSKTQTYWARAKMSEKLFFISHIRATRRCLFHSSVWHRSSDIQCLSQVVWHHGWWINIPEERHIHTNQYYEDENGLRIRSVFDHTIVQ